MDDGQLDSTTLKFDMMNRQLFPCTGSGKGVQDSANLAKEGSVRQQASKKNLVEELMSKAHSSNTPTLHFSNPHVE